MNNRLFLLLFACVGIGAMRCGEAPKDNQDSQFYSLDDYDKVLKYDVHVHISSDKPYFVEQSKKENFKLVTVNVNAGEPIVEQREYAIRQVEAFPEQVKYTTTFDVAGWDDKDWQAKTLAYLDESFKKGAIGVKVWKNIGMELKDKNGKFVMIDDPRFDTIFDFIEKNNKTLIAHIGEPKNCWLPIEEMTVKNDRDYFSNHPQYHMYLHPEYPSYEDQINARDRMLEKHPHLRVSGAHMASLEWSVDELAKRLDKFPNLAVDMAERISHLQYQSARDFQKVYDFIIKYQDQLLYGTDLSTRDDKDSAQVMQYMHDFRFGHWRYFVTDEMMEAPEVEGQFKALHLPKEVVDKIYRKNAEKWFPAFTEDKGVARQ